MKIALTGTPGVGKTIVAELLKKSGKFTIIDLNEKLLEKYKLTKDTLRNTWEIDIERAKKEIHFPKNCIIEGHLSHFFKVDWVVVLRCEPKELKERLKVKNWSDKKIIENLEAELIGIIAEEARQNNKRVYDIDTTKLSQNDVASLIKEKIKKQPINESIDFLGRLN